MEQIVYTPFPRESSNLKAYNYNPEKKELRLQLNSSYYKYDNVPQKVLDELLASESHGKYFYANIRDNEKYPVTKISYGPIPSTKTNQKKG